ncbi:MAG: PH domain-containing protein [Chloroflexi bacterium]|nr:PH domain-containing protein [Chloroflexota bacterium]
MDLLEHFKTLSIFDQLRREQLELLAAQFKSRHYFPGEILVAQGDLGNRFFIFDGGVVSLRMTDPNGVERTVGVLPEPPIPGSDQPRKNYMGEQMMTSQEAFDYQAYAVTNVDAHILDRGDFDALINAHPDILRDLPFIEKAEYARTHGFRWVEPGERITSVFHKHWWAIIPALAQFLVAVLVAWLINLGAEFLGFGFGIALFAVGVLLSLIYFLIKLYDWHNDQYIVTTRRVAHVERELIAVELTEAVPLDKVIGSKIERSGISGIIGVSNVVIQTAGRQEGNVSFKAVSEGPAIVRQVEGARIRIRSLRAADQRERERERIQAKLREYILPHVVQKERAVAAAKVQPPPPPPPPTFTQKLRKSIHSLFELQYQRDSVTTWRKHWIVLLKQELQPVAALLVLDTAFIFYALTPDAQVLPYGGYLLGGLVLLALALGWVWWQWEDWRNDTYAVTSTQVVDAERLPLGIREKSITAQLDQIQDVRVEVQGILPSILDYGDLRIETAGQGSQMIFKSIANPRDASEEVFKHIEAQRQRVLQREIDLRDRLTIDSLIGYDRIRKEEERHRKEEEESNAARVLNEEEDDDEDNNLL